MVSCVSSYCHIHTLNLIIRLMALILLSDSSSESELMVFNLYSELNVVMRQASRCRELTSNMVDFAPHSFTESVSETLPQLWGSLFLFYTFQTDQSDNGNLVSEAASRIIPKPFHQEWRSGISGPEHIRSPAKPPPQSSQSRGMKHSPRWPPFCC